MLAHVLNPTLRWISMYSMYGDLLSLLILILLLLLLLEEGN